MNSPGLVVIGLFNRHSSFDVPWNKFLVKTSKELASPTGWGNILFARIYIGKDEIGSDLWEKAGLSSTPSFVLIRDGEIEDSLPVYSLAEVDVTSKILSWIIDSAV